MSVQLFACSESPYCRTVKGLLRLRGIAHTTTLFDWNSLRAFEASGALARLNPKNEVPVLVWHGRPLVDSFLIAAFLEGSGWLGSGDALVFRTADVELRDALMTLYAKREATPDIARATKCLRAVVASPLPSELQLPLRNPLSDPVASAGTLHVAFLALACLQLMERFAGLCDESTRADFGALVDPFVRLDAVGEVQREFQEQQKIEQGS